MEKKSEQKDEISAPRDWPARKSLQKSAEITPYRGVISRSIVFYSSFFGRREHLLQEWSSPCLFENSRRVVSLYLTRTYGSGFYRRNFSLVWLEKSWSATTVRWSVIAPVSPHTYVPLPPISDQNITHVSSFSPPLSGMFSNTRTLPQFDFTTAWFTPAATKSKQPANELTYL
jgi:hypothetical protein